MGDKGEVRNLLDRGMTIAKDYYDKKENPEGRT